MESVRSSKEIAAEKAKLIAEAEQLQHKSRTETLTAEEDTRLEECLSSCESLTTELVRSLRDERIGAEKARMELPTRPAPAPTVPAQYRQHDQASVGEGLSLWFGSFGPEADRSAAKAYKARTAGFELGNTSARIPVNYDGLNFKARTILSKAGSGSGADYVYKTYSSKVTEYLTYFSPILGFLPSETTADGNLRTYFKIDDTSMESAYTTATGGTETVPTIPDTNLATASVDIGCFQITSGFQKAGNQILRDSFVSLEDKIAKANSNSHARKLEREILTASGNGTTGVQGLTSVATALPDVADWSQDAVLDLINSIPVQYRKNVLLVSNDDTKQALVKKLRDDVQRSLFDKTADMGQEFETFDGKKFIVSQYMPDDTILAFVPDFYQLRMVEGQVFQQFTERFWPNVAWSGLMSFGGAWLGPTSAVKSLSLS